MQEVNSEWPPLSGAREWMIRGRRPPPGPFAELSASCSRSSPPAMAVSAPLFLPFHPFLIA